MSKKNFIFFKFFININCDFKTYIVKQTYLDINICYNLYEETLTNNQRENCFVFLLVCCTIWSMKKIEAIYCDFDGTITKKDSVNVFFEMFASEKWLYYEDLWIKGKISSKENAINQVKLLNNISQRQLEDYINSIEIDEYFLDFVDYVKSKNIKLTILSDGFDLFIQKTLERYNLDIPYYANKFIYDNGKFSIEFPYYNQNCDKKAGMCKCQKVTENYFCYIGDGTSDLCIASKADILFASKNLHKYCEENDIKHHYFTSFCDIINMLGEKK